ncbi:MAG: prepilin-type N-terminal cleavage/methylation domain-containing protein [Desulfobacterales bacterium]|jgi:prepilin-type N-terminal cleavage/methylation domain-containing protein
MKPINHKGLTLVELLFATAILGIIAAAALPLLSVLLESHKNGSARFQLYHEGLIAMERMTDGVRRSTYLLIPNAHSPTRDILAFSGYINNDNDFYFDDPLFPRIDEDTGAEMSGDDEPGIIGVDDDGDGLVDEHVTEHGDDDEDGATEEDPTNGYDDDGDGNVDEDALHDSNDDNASGIAGMDDNGDGQVDNGDTATDDDEDGLRNEDSLDPVVYAFDSGTNTLEVSHIRDGQTIILSEHVTAFQVNYEAPEKILIVLTLTGDDGETITFTEYVYPRNTFQKTGKRVK